MLTEIKLVQNTHASLKCWYRTSLVFRRKTNANKNQTSRNTHYSLKCWYRTSLVFRRNTKCYQESKWFKIHTAPYNAGIEPVWYSEEKQMLKESKLVQNTHGCLKCWYRTSLLFRRRTNPTKNQTSKNTHRSLQCWYRTSLVFRRKTNANKNQTGTKYTLLPTMLV